MAVQFEGFRLVCEVTCIHETEVLKSRLGLPISQLSLIPLCMVVVT